MAAASERGNRARSGSTAHETGALARYLREIESIPVLSPEEEHALTLVAQDGNDDAIEKLVYHNLRFVVSLARRYARNGVAIEDLIGEGNIGLLFAARRFDPDHDCRLISYARWWIRRRILAYLTNRSRLVRIPEDKVAQILNMGRISERLLQVNQAIPSADDLAMELRMPAPEIRHLRAVSTRAVSLDQSYDGEDDFKADTLRDEAAGGIEIELDQQSRRERVLEALRSLAPREKDVLVRHFGLSNDAPESLTAIGEDYGVTRERVRQLKERALRKIRQGAHAEALLEYVA